MKEQKTQGHDHRYLVNLLGTPGIQVEISQDVVWRGQGLAPGIEGEALVETWMDWRKGRENKVENGTLVKIILSRSKL